MLLFIFTIVTTKTEEGTPVVEETVEDVAQPLEIGTITYYDDLLFYHYTYIYYIDIKISIEHSQLQLNRPQLNQKQNKKQLHKLHKLQKLKLKVFNLA